MALWIISDLHLSFSQEKPMEIFGEHWTNHYDKIKASWISSVAQEDTVIIPGDISWALHFRDALVDLEWIDALPGKKLLLRGNHDYWWTTLTKMRKHFKTIDFIQNNSYLVDGVGIVGTRGWISPSDRDATEDDKRIFQRELMRLQLSLDSLPKDCQSIVCVVHYPPFDEGGRANGVLKVLEPYPVKGLYYGHIHTVFDACNPRVLSGIPINCTSSDYLNFKLLPIGLNEEVNHATICD